MLTGSLRASAVRVPGDWSRYAQALEAAELCPAGLGDAGRPNGVAAGRWRRMSRLSRWAVDALLEVLPAEPGPVPLIVGSAMGEVVPSSAYLDRMILEGPTFGSPTAFQNSVYNATAAHLSMAFGMRGASETVTAGLATGWMAVSRGLELLADHPEVLVVLADDRNPTTATAYGDRPYGEAVVALRLGRGTGVSVIDGRHPHAAFGRRVAMPYESTTGWAGPASEAVIGLHITTGVLASLATGQWTVDVDDGLAISGQISG